MSTLTRKPEWDGTFSLLLDGEVIVERKPLAEIEEKEAFIQARLKLPLAPRQIADEDDPPTLRDTGYDDPPSLR